MDAGDRVMSSGEILQGVVRQLREQLGGDTADGELLARYAGLFFARPCRQLPDRHEAEDVFQATFLALARAASRLGRPASLANWLYTVALRQARKARRRAARRAALESSAPPRPQAGSDPLADITAREFV